MRILFIVPYVPSLIRVRPYNLIRHLAERGHDLTILTLWTGEQERADAEQLERLGFLVEGAELPKKLSIWNSLKALPTRTPLQAVYCWQPDLARKLVAILDGGKNGKVPFDIVHVEHLRGAHYGLAAKGWNSQLPVVWDSVDSISMLFRQASNRSKSLFGKWLTRLELGRTERYEVWLAQQFERVTVTSPTDREAFEDLAHNGEQLPIQVVPNGVDLSYFNCANENDREESTVVVSGKMSYHANVTMALHLVNEIMPYVWKQMPHVKVQVVGKDPPGEIMELARNSQVTVTGTVADIRPYLQKATLAVVPLIYGAGIQNKALEAMACGTPLVSSPQAVGALTAVPDRDLLVAADPESFAEQMICLLKDPERRSRIGQAGRRYVEAQHRWESIAAQLEKVYEEIIISG